MPITGAGNFSGGQTLIPRVTSDMKAVCKTVDGFFVDNGALVPTGGITAKSASAITLPAVKQSPYVFKVGSDTFVGATDTDGRIRYIKCSESNPTWLAVNSYIYHSMPFESKAAKYNDNIIMPDKYNVGRWSPSNIADIDYSRRLGLKSPSDYSTNIVKPAISPIADASSTFSDTDKDKVVSTTDFVNGNSPAGYWSEWNSDRAWISKMTTDPPPGVQQSEFIQFYYHQADGDNRKMFFFPEPTAIDVKGKKFLNMWIRIDADDSSAVNKITNLNIQLLDATTTLRTFTLSKEALLKNVVVDGVSWETTWADHSIELNRWYFVKFELEDINQSTADLGAIKEIAISYIGDGSAPLGIVFSIANMRFQNTTTTTYWPDPPAYYIYRYCFAYKPGDNETDQRWIVSNPSYFAKTGNKIQDGFVVNVSCNVQTAIGDHANYMLLYRASSDAPNDYSLVKIWYIANRLGGASATFQDRGCIDESDGLVHPFDESDNQMLPEDVPDSIKTMYFSHNIPPSARYAITSTGFVYLACCDWNESKQRWMSPAALRISNYNEPWYFPTSTSSSSEDADGTMLDGFATTGTTITGLGMWQGNVVVFLDNEFFILSGNGHASFYLTRVDSIGCASNRTIMDCRSSLIWHDGNDFYLYSGGVANNISKLAIDATKVNLTLPHDSAYYNDKYILYCTYNGVPSLLIYDLTVNSWVVRTCPSLYGIAGDAINNKLYGITSTGILCEIFTGTQDLGVDKVFTVETQPFVVSSPASFEPKAFGKCVIDATATSDTTININASALGNVNKTVPPTDSFPVALKPNKCSYEHNLSLSGFGISAKLTYTGSNPPTIHNIGLTYDEVSK